MDHLCLRSVSEDGEIASREGGDTTFSSRPSLPATRGSPPSIAPERTCIEIYPWNGERQPPHLVRAAFDHDRTTPHLALESCVARSDFYADPRQRKRLARGAPERRAPSTCLNTQVCMEHPRYRVRWTRA